MQGGPLKTFHSGIEKITTNDLAAIYETAYSHMPSIHKNEKQCEKKYIDKSQTKRI